MKGFLPYIIIFIFISIIYAVIANGDKGGFDSIGRFIVFAIVVIVTILLFKNNKNNSNDK